MVTKILADAPNYDIHRAWLQNVSLHLFHIETKVNAVS